MEQGEDDEYSRFLVELRKDHKQCQGHEEEEFRRLKILLDVTGSQLSSLGFPNVLEGSHLDAQDVSSDLGAARQTKLSQWVLGRLCVLRQLDWLEAVCSILIPDVEGTNTDKLKMDRMRLYWAFHDKDPVEIAQNCAKLGDVQLVEQFLQIFPYALMSSMMEILQSMFTVVEIDKIEYLLVVLMEMRKYTKAGGPKIGRVPDWVERKESVAILKLHGGPWKHYTEVMTKIAYGWHTLSDKQMESWVLHHAMEMERITGLYSDAMSLLQCGLRVLERYGYSSAILKHQALLFQEYEICLMLKEELRRQGFKDGNGFPESMVQYSSAGIDGRIAEFLQLVLLCQNFMNINDMRKLYMKKYFDVQKILDPSMQGVLHSAILAFAYSHTEWILGFLKAEAVDPMIISDKDAICLICLEIIRLNPGECCELDAYQRESFQRILLEIVEELVMSTKQGYIRQMFEETLKMSRIVSLIQELGSNLQMHEVTDIMNSNGSLDMLKSIVNEKFRSCANKSEWMKLLRILRELATDLNISPEHEEPLQEYVCQCSLRLGHVAPTEEFLESVEPAKRGALIIMLAHEAVCNSEELRFDTVNSIKKILAMLPDEANIQREMLLVDTVVKLRELGIKVSAHELQESSNVSQLFQNAIDNVSSTSGLHDIDRIVEMFGSLDMGFTSDKILQQLAHTALTFEDAALCEKLCLKLVESGSLESLHIVSKVAESDLKIDPGSRKKMLSFALLGAKGKDILKILAKTGCGGDESDFNILNDLTDGTTLIGDERTIMIQVASAMFSSDLQHIVAWIRDFLSESHEAVKPDLRRSIYMGIICGTSLKIFSTCIGTDSEKSFNLDHEELLQLPVSIVCFWGCKNLESSIENIEEHVQQSLIQSLQRLGSCLVSIADENRLSVINDKNAERLWGSGDLDAQKQILRQMTDKIAAYQVSNFGEINQIDPISDKGETQNQMKVSDLSNVAVLARRCGTQYEEVEQMFVESVLNRHGCSKAFGDSWNHLSTTKPSKTLEIVLNFTLESQKLGNYEVLRSIEMLEQCIRKGACIESNLANISPPLADLYRLSLDFSGKCTLDLRPFIEPFFVSLCHRIDKHSRTQKSVCLPGWFIQISHPDNAKLLYGFLRDLSSIYRDIADDAVVETLEEYPICPYVVILAALSEILENGCSISILSDFLAGLGSELLLSLGFAFASDNDSLSTLKIPDIIKEKVKSVSIAEMINFYRCIINLTGDDDLSGNDAVIRDSIIQTHAELVCRRDLYEYNNFESLFSAISEMSVRLAHSSGQISMIVAPLVRDSVTEGMKYDSGVSRIMDTLILLTLDETDVCKNDLLRHLYVDSLSACICTLSGSSDSEMTKGEAIQNIFGIVRSLDCPPCEGLDLIRSSVYSAIKEYLSNSRSKVDAIHSEIQIQLIEMMMAIGKDKWLDWQPEGGDAWSIQSDSLLHSRLVSHFSISWKDALENAAMEQSSMETCGGTNVAFCELSKQVSTPEQAFTLWSALVSIVFPHYNKNEIDAAEILKESFESAMERVLSHGDVNNILTAINDFCYIHGQLPPMLQQMAICSISDVRYKALVELMINADQHLESVVFDVFQLVKSCDTSSQHKIAAVLAIIHSGLLSELVQKLGISAVRDIIRSIDSNPLYLEKMVFVSAERSYFDCPLRVLVCSYMISHLILKGERVPASYLAFETLGLDDSLRVKDSGMPFITSLLSSLYDVSWTGKKSDLYSLGFPGTSMLTQILEEFPKELHKAVRLCQ